MFDYIHKSDVIKTQTVTVPRILFSSQRFQELSPMAKALYAMLKEAMDNEEVRRNPHMYTDICMDLNSTADAVAVEKNDSKANMQGASLYLLHKVVVPNF